MVRLSCSTLSFDGFEDNDFALSISMMPSAGFRWIELNCWHPSNLTPAGLRRTAERCAASGLEPSAVYGARFGGDPSKDVGHKIRLMEAAGFLGCSRIVATGAQRSEEGAMDRLIRVLRETAPAAEELGVLICLENHAGSVLERSEDYERVFESIDSAAVGICADDGHFDAAGADMDRLFDRCGRKVRHLHLKENKGTGAVRFVKFGRGTTDHHGLIRRALDLGFSGFIDIELSPTSEGLVPGEPDLENLIHAREEFERYAVND